MFEIVKKLYKAHKKYGTVYIAIDIHGTIFKPTFSKTENYNYYPFAKKTLQLLSRKSDVKKILWSGCYPEAFDNYISHFLKNEIDFNYINCNPECFNNEYACLDDKFYFDVGLDDKFGFNPYIQWFLIYIFYKFFHK